MSRVLLHISDLHFGRIEPGLPEALLQAARLIAPDLVVVSGDLTQRARIHEFQNARAFLDRLPFPKLVVPGNHDIPLHNLYNRFVQRLERFRTYITDDLEPAYLDPEMAVFGVNTARSLTWKEGRINHAQIEALRMRMCALPAGVARVVVTHHPFEIPDSFHRRNLVGSARAALERWTGCHPDLLLCGHLHVGDSTTTLNRYGPGAEAIVVTAGTAVSSRGRGVPNSFNAISLEDRTRVTVHKWLWDSEAAAFRTVSEALFLRTEPGWIRSGDP